MCRRGLDWGVMIAQAVTARGNVVSGARGQEAPLPLSTGEEFQNEQEVQHRQSQARGSPEGTIHQRLRLQLLFCVLA